MKAARTLYLALFGALLLTGCKTRTVTERVEVPVEIPRVVRDSVTRLTHVADTVRMIDTVRITAQGVDRVHYEYRDRWHTDTVRTCRVDTVGVPVEVVRTVEKPVERELTRWQSFRIDAFWWLAAALALSLCALFRRPLGRVLTRIITRK